MNKNNWQRKPSSFAETVKLVENYAVIEIRQETSEKQLYYHTLSHALGVKRRANKIFHNIQPVLAQSIPLASLDRVESLINLCAIAHDMVQCFHPSTNASTPRKRAAGVSETATVKKLLNYIRNLNQQLLTDQVDKSILFSDLDLQIIQDGILATICNRDPQAGKTNYSFSPYSIYQPYLYDSQRKISVVGSIIALADLGTLGMEGAENYIREGVLIFLEDNLDLKELILNCECNPAFDRHSIKARLLNMTKFIVSMAKERQARLELEISGFTASIRQILRQQVFIYLNAQNIQKIEAIVPTDENTKLSDLIKFFCLNA
ncbi:hypothetical protein [Pleurocapsa sp. PCC 7319]|uniref:hypothetical protein n=1 Tax=Pleurocapsa sp. PCC 7319 TaxID=118161 RepID=UPI0003476F0E|nr:hypothetical protein [Pleurocapsa sp. PCC 7319]